MPLVAGAGTVCVYVYVCVYPYIFSTRAFFLSIMRMLFTLLIPKSVPAR